MKGEEKEVKCFRAGTIWRVGEVGSGVNGLLPVTFAGMECGVN